MLAHTQQVRCKYNYETRASALRASVDMVASVAARPSALRNVREGSLGSRTGIHLSMCAIYIIVGCDMNKIFNRLYYYTSRWAGLPEQSNRGFAIVKPVPCRLVHLPVLPKALPGS